MKRKDFVPVTETAKYAGRTMNWTEECTGNITIPAGTKLYHFSDTKLNALRPKTTCFYTDDRGTGYCYVLTAEKDYNVPSFGSEEVRIDLTEKSRIQFVGRVYVKTYYEKQKIWDDRRECMDYPYKIIDNRKF